jgi:hypothetical protein
MELWFQGREYSGEALEVQPGSAIEAFQVYACSEQAQRDVAQIVQQQKQQEQAMQKRLQEEQRQKAEAEQRKCKETGSCGNMYFPKPPPQEQRRQQLEQCFQQTPDRDKSRCFER